MKTLFITLLIAFIFTLNTAAFAADDHDHKHEKSEKHKEHHTEGDFAQHDDHDRAQDNAEGKTKGDK